MSSIDYDKLVQASRLQGEDEEETTLFVSQLQEARAYLLSFPWCKEIQKEYFGGGVGGVVAVFLFQILQSDPTAGNLLWVIAGDMPSAYIVTDEATDSKKALLVYADLMDEWSDCVLSGGEISRVYPISSPANAENARDLARRMASLRSEIVPNLVFPTPR